MTCDRHGDQTQQTVEQEEPEQSPAEEMAEEMLELELSTIDDGKIRGRIMEVKPSRLKEDYIIVIAQAPGGVEVTKKMRKPVPWNDEYRFTRLVESLGYNAGTCHMIEGEPVILEKDYRGNWTIEDPKDADWYFKHYRKKVAKTLAVLGSLLAGLVLGGEAVSRIVVPQPQVDPSSGQAFVQATETVLSLAPLMVTVVIMVVIASVFSSMAQAEE